MGCTIQFESQHVELWAIYPDLPVDILWTLISTRRVFTDLSATLLMGHDQVTWYGEETLALQARLSSHLSSDVLPLSVPLAWDGRLWLVEALSDPVRLRPEVGEPLILPLAEFQNLRKVGSMWEVNEASPDQQDGMSGNEEKASESLTPTVPASPIAVPAITAMKPATIHVGERAPVRDPVGEMRVDLPSSTCTFKGIIGVSLAQMQETGVWRVECPECATTRSLNVKGSTVKFPSSAASNIPSSMG